MQVEIIKMDDLGRGIGYLNNKIIFIPKTLIGDIVNVNIIVDKKKYSIGKVVSYIKKSNDYINPICPYFEKCGGCSYLNINYNKAFDIKINNYKNKLLKNNIICDIEVIKSDNIYNYRNKITLKIKDGNIGYYEEGTNNIVCINKCIIANDTINNFIPNINKLNIKNGEIVIRCNYKNELLIILKTLDKVNINNLIYDNVVGIVLNNECIYGNNHFVDKINNLLFEVSYNSFFQVNPYITSELFNVVNKYIDKTDDVLDLYCGVGTLSLNASINANSVYGIEIIKNAIDNASKNKILNNISNAIFKVEDLSKSKNFKYKFNTLIVDPPRSGIDKSVMDIINDKKPEKVIYVSCDKNTFIRDINILKNYYNINKIYMFDMFSNTYHVECVVTLYRKNSRKALYNKGL